MATFRKEMLFLGEVEVQVYDTKLSSFVNIDSSDHVLFEDATKMKFLRKNEVMISLEKGAAYFLSILLLKKIAYVFIYCCNCNEDIGLNSYTFIYTYQCLILPCYTLGQATSILQCLQLCFIFSNKKHF